MPDDRVICPFCYPAPEVYTLPQLHHHLQNHVHKFEEKKYCIQRISPDKASYYIFITRSGTCPFQFCQQDLNFDNQLHYGAHIRKHRDMKSCWREMMEGLVFWWRIHPTNDSKKNISLAFLEEERMRELLDFVREEREDLPDPEDSVWVDRGQDNHAMENELEEDEIAENFMHLSQLAYLQGDYSTQSQPTQPPVDPQDMDVDEVPDPDFVQYRHVQYPVTLSQYNFAVLHLVDFPGSPIVPYCLVCKKVIGSDNGRALLEHRRTTCTVIEVLEEQEDTAESPRPVDREDVDDSVDGSEEEHTVAPPKRDIGLGQRFQTCLETHGVTKIGTVIPIKVIPAIPLLNTLKAFWCPEETCFKAFNTHGSARDHCVRDHGHSPEFIQQGPTQTLGTHGDRSRFKVQEPEPEIRPEVDVATLMHNFLHAKTEVKSVAALPGVANSNIFFDFFNYMAAYPKNLNDYSTFVRRLLPKPTIIAREGQDTSFQLLAVSILLYGLKGRVHVRETDYTIRAQIANKDYWKNSASGANVPCFNALQHVGSLQRYATTMTSFASYILNVLFDPTLDPRLCIDNNIKKAADRLSVAMKALVETEEVTEDLQKIKRLVKNQDHLTEEKRDLGALVLVEPRVIPRRLAAAVATLWHHLHRFLLSLVLHPINIPSNTITLPITRFLALLAYNVEGRSFHSVHTCHFHMGQLQWMMRLVVLIQYHLLQSAEPEKSFETILIPLHDEYLRVGTLTPFGALQDQLRFCGRLCSMVTSPPNITWSSDNRAVSYNGMEVVVDNFIAMLHTLKEKAQQILRDDILLRYGEEILGPRQRVEKANPVAILDDPNEGKAGYSYFTCNKVFTRLESTLKDTIAHNPELLNQFTQRYVTGLDISWDYARISKWLVDVDQFILILSVLVYFLGGMVPRVPELLSLRIHNTTHAKRNLYCLRGFLVFFQTYTKALSMTSTPFPVSRILAEPIQDLVEIYVTVVQPVQEKFYLLHEKPEFSTSKSLLFTQNGLPMSPTQFTDFLRLCSQTYLQSSLSVRAWRQITISMGNNLLDEEITQMRLPLLAITAQSAHRQATAEVAYDRREGATLPGTNTAQYLRFEKLSLGWHELLQFPHSLESSKRILALPKAPTVPFPDMTKLMLDFGSRLTLSCDNTIERVMNDKFGKMKVKQLEDTPHFTKICPLRVAVTHRSVQLFQELYNGKSFRSEEQGECIEYARSRRDDPLLVVLPMGYGKSSIYLTPLLDRSESSLTTLLLVPLVALGYAAYEKVLQTTISPYIITGGTEANPDPTLDMRAVDANIVIATYDRFLSNKSLQRWLAEKSKEGKIARVVVDEAHTIITDRHWRDQFYSFYDTLYTTVVAPVIYLTGTLPPEETDEFVGLHGAHPRVVVSRTRTNIQSLSYHVDRPLQIRKGEEIDYGFCQRVNETIVPHLNRYPQTRAIIFTRTVKESVALSEHMKCAYFNAQLQFDDKIKTLRSLLDEENGDIQNHLIVSTTAMSLGLDYSQINHVWFYGDPYSFIDFSQMAARGGRGGSTAEVRVFPSRSTLKELDPLWIEFKTTKGCRRIPISKRMDGIPTSCDSMVSAARCDNCLREDNPDEPVQNGLDVEALEIVANRLREQMNRRNRFLSVFHLCWNYLLLNCVYCLLDKQPNPRHSQNHCPRKLYLKRASLKGYIANLPGRKHISGFVVCTGCHMPQSKTILGAVNRHIESLNPEGGDCSDTEMGLDVILALLGSRHLSPTLLNRSGHNVDQVLPLLFTRYNQSPCSSSDPANQFLRLHFLLLAAVVTLPYPPNAVKEFVEEPWWEVWRFPETMDLDTTIVDQLECLEDEREEFLDVDASSLFIPVQNPVYRALPNGLGDISIDDLKHA